MKKQQPKFRSTKFTGVYARGGTFSFKLSRVRKPDGSVGDQWVGGFKTAGDARDARAAALHSVKTNTYVPATKLTVEEFLITKWLPSVEQRLRASTYSGYKSLLAVHVVPRIGATRLCDLDAAHLNRLYSELLTGGRRRNGTGTLSPKTVRNVAVVVGKALADAERWR